MMYYIRSIEQITGDTEGTYTEYAGVEKVADENLAMSKYYKKLSDVSADIEKKHTYMNIHIENSVGGIIKQDVVGQYMVEEPAPEPEPEGE